jgi:WD40 repeat protein/serine/threonine protein kinase
MPVIPQPDEELLRRLPLPLAQLYVRAHNAKADLERHQAAFYLWEVALKLLGATCVAEYVRLDAGEPDLDECLQNLARPSLGHWWEFTRRLTPVLAGRGVPGFAALRDLLDRRRDDLPRVAGLDAALREDAEGKATARATVLPGELLARLVNYRSRQIGHGAAGRRPGAFYARMGGSLLAGAAELLRHLDVLAGRKLIHVAEVRQVGGFWRIERAELAGESPRRLETLDHPREQANALPDGDRVYLLADGVEADTSGLTELYPLMVYDAEANECALFNGRRGKAGADFLCYTSGRTLTRSDLGRVRSALMIRALRPPAVGPETADDPAAAPPADDADGEAPAHAGDRMIGEFKLLSELGRGGMGVVYRAVQPALGREVALKVLLRPGDPKAEARFRREIRALGRVDHPHLMKVFASGADGDRWFYAMEVVEGPSLAAVGEKLAAAGRAKQIDLPTWQAAVSTAAEEQRLRETPVGAEQPVEPSPVTPGSGAIAAPEVIRGGREYADRVVTLVRQAAEAAEALHRHGIVHRDIKPGNILVDESGTRATLMDLGLAQLADDAEGKLTRTRQFVGTLRYASPEQVLAVARVDARSDVYGLGATLWEMLALRPLFGATEETPTPTLMEAIQREEPQRLRRCNPGIARDLEAVVHKCLEKRARDRYATAQELADDLSRYLDGEPVRARPVGAVSRALRWARRRPVIAGLVGGLVVALAAGIGGVLWAYAEAVTERNRTRQEAERADRAAEKSRSEAEAARAAKEDANKQAARAEAQADAARRAERLARQREYDANMWLTQNAWEHNQVGRFLDLLESQKPRSGQEDLRSFEWHYWRKQFQRGHVTLKGHTEWVQGISYSPDGKRLASGSGDKTVKVWDAATGQEVLTLKGHTSGVYGVSYSPDSKRLASASWDHTVKVWDAATGQEVLTLEGHTRPVNGVSYSPDGKRLASASYDRTVKVWDAASGQEVLTLKGHTDDVKGISYSPDGKRLASASGDKTVKVWDAASGQDALTLKGHTDTVYDLSFSPDGKRLASASGDKTVKVWDAASGQEVLTLKGHTDTVYDLSFSPNGERLASASRDGTVKVWDAASGQEVLTLKGHTAAETGVSYSPDGKRLASASEDQTVKVWDAATGQEVLTLKGQTFWVESVRYRADSKRLASVRDMVEVRYAATWQPVLTLVGHTSFVTGVSYSPDGKRLASASYDGTVEVWDAASGQEVLTLKGHTRSMTSVSYSPDGKRLASASGDTVKVWDAASGQEVLTLKGHTDDVKGISYSPDGKRLASASGDKTVKVWDAASGQEVLTLKGHASRVTSVTFSPDGKRLASASYDGTIKVWDADPHD